MCINITNLRQKTRSWILNQILLFLDLYINKKTDGTQGGQTLCLGCNPSGTPFSPLLQIYRLPALQHGIPVLELEWLVFIHGDPMHFQPFDLSTNCVLFAVKSSLTKEHLKLSVKQFQTSLVQSGSVFNTPSRIFHVALFPPSSL